LTNAFDGTCYSSVLKGATPTNALTQFLEIKTNGDVIWRRCRGPQEYSH